MIVAALWHGRLGASGELLFRGQVDEETHVSDPNGSGPMQGVGQAMEQVLNQGQVCAIHEAPSGPTGSAASAGNLPAEQAVFPLSQPNGTMRIIENGKTGAAAAPPHDGLHRAPISTPTRP